MQNPMAEIRPRPLKERKIASVAPAGAAIRAETSGTVAALSRRTRFDKLALPGGMSDLKGRTLRGGFANLCGQAVNFSLRLSSLIILARLLDPKDFGLVAMVTVVTGVYGMFVSAGLSAATVQRDNVVDAQISTLFWINLMVGALLAALCMATAPALVAFYREPRLFWVTQAMGLGFFFNAAGVQHIALLQRQLRYVTLAVIDAVSQVSSIAVGVGLALAGFGYWALVGTAIMVPITSTCCAWVSMAWIPGRPRWNVGIRSMLFFGGTITLNGLVVYAAYNFEKVLLGRFWGADSLGIYGRAYQLTRVPVDFFNGAIGGVTFSALSRLQGDPARLKNYFLKGYSLAISFSLPATLYCALFANDIVRLLLGPNWIGAGIILRLLAPTVLIFAMINPLAWLLLSIGRQGRSLKIGLVIAPLIMTAYVIGLPHGPTGVAIAYSVAMSLWLIPHIVWCLHGTTISLWDLLLAIGRPLLSGAVAGAVALVIEIYMGPSTSSLLRLLVGGGVMLAVYVCMLLLVLGQLRFYLDLFEGLRRPAASGAFQAGERTP